MTASAASLHAAPVLSPQADRLNSALPVPGRIMLEFNLTRAPFGVIAAMTTYRIGIFAIFGGFMMNTRALMELVVINVGFQLGVISQPMFTMLVIMAIVSTVLTTPALRRYLPRARAATITG